MLTLAVLRRRSSLFLSFILGSSFVLSSHANRNGLCFQQSPHMRQNERRSQRPDGVTPLSLRTAGFHEKVKKRLVEKILFGKGKNNSEERTEITLIDRTLNRRQLLSVYKSSMIASVGITATTVFEQPVGAISPEEASKSYDGYAETYDDLDGGSAAKALGIDDARSELLGKASGRVLEIGAGTGLNLEKYNFGDTGVTSLTLVDISEGMLGQARSKVKTLQIPCKVDFIKADATTDLLESFGPDAFDTAIDTFSLCVMGNDGAKKCLQQLAQVVKSRKNGGKILLLENSRANNPVLGWYQDLTASTAADNGGKGCMYNQDVSALIQQTRGLSIQSEHQFAAGLFRSFDCTRD
mmetsp:Transcript_24445/g.44209  ORF Transcript_24445/g.44209 Transcript_24445/m.44209 type:complete len:353 (+) Transcript_24445:288-1346(+)